MEISVSYLGALRVEVSGLGRFMVNRSGFGVQASRDGIWFPRRLDSLQMHLTSAIYADCSDLLRPHLVAAKHAQMDLCSASRCSSQPLRVKLSSVQVSSFSRPIGYIEEQLSSSYTSRWTSARDWVQDSWESPRVRFGGGGSTNNSS